MSVDSPQDGGDHLLMPYEGKGESEADAAQSLLDAMTDDESAATADDEPTEEQEASESEETETESEDESDESEGEDEQDEVEPEAPESRKHKFRADGKDHEVTYDELLRHASAGVDYTRKTADLANQRKGLEQIETDFRGARDQYAQKVAELEQIIASNQPKEPDWDKLRQENPAEYAALKEEWRERKEAAELAKSERLRVEAEQRAEQTKAFSDHMAQQAELLEAAVPEWKDEAKASDEKRRLVEFATKTYGWTAKDLENVTDHRAILMLRDSMLYRELKSKGADAVKQKAVAAKVLKPGGRTNDGPLKGHKAEIKRLDDRLRRSGKVADAAKLFEKFL